MIRGAIFDIDGTLLDSMSIWDDVGARYLRSIQVEPEKKLGEYLFTMTLDEGAAYMKEHYHLTQTTEEIISGVLGIIETFYREEVTFKPGMKEILQSYHSEHIPMALATTSDRELIMAAFTRLGVGDWFTCVLTASELQTSKKEPFIYQKAAELMGTAIEETAVYEDVLHAIQTVKSAGFYTVAVYDNSSKNDWPAITELADETIKNM